MQYSRRGFSGTDLWTHHRSDGEDPCIVSILVVAWLVSVLTGEMENGWMYQMPKTFRGFPGMPFGYPSKCNYVNELLSSRLIGPLGVRRLLILHQGKDLGHRQKLEFRLSLQHVNVYVAFESFRKSVGFHPLDLIY